MARFKGAMAEVVRDFKPGYRLSPRTGSGHYRILDPEGNVVRDAITDAPIALSETAYDGRLTRKLRGQLVKAGVVFGSDQDRRLELAEKVAAESPVIEAIAQEQPALRLEVEETFFGPRYREALPSITISLDWDEFMQLQRAAGFVIDKGPRTIAQMEGFLTVANRAKALMERQVEINRNRQGVYTNGTAVRS